MNILGYLFLELIITTKFLEKKFDEEMDKLTCETDKMINRIAFNLWQIFKGNPNEMCVWFDWSNRSIRYQRRCWCVELNVYLAMSLKRWQTLSTSHPIRRISAANNRRNALTMFCGECSAETPKHQQCKIPISVINVDHALWTPFYLNSL